MYGFIEKAIADVLVQCGIISSYELFALSDGGHVAIIDRTPFALVRRAIQSIISSHYSNYSENNVLVVPCDISGMRTLLHPFWTEDLYFDAITPGNVKETPQYIEMRSQPSSQRFIWADFFNYFKDEIMRIKGMTEDVEGEEEEHEEEEEEEVVEPKLPEPKPVESEYNLIRRVISNYTNNFSDSGDGHCVATGSRIQSEAIFEFSKQMQKHVIAVDADIRSYYRDIKSKLEKYDSNIIWIFPIVHGSKFSNGPDMTHTLFGYDFNGLAQVHVEDGNPGGKKHPLGPAFADYDYVYRDFKTGIIWAVQKKNEITLMFSTTIPDKLYDTIFIELANRYMGRMPYESMKKRDFEYFEKLAEHDRENFIKLGVNGAKSIVEEFRSQYDIAKEQYADLLSKAMEQAKVAQRLEEALVAMDENKMAEEELKRCQKAYDEVASIPQVTAVKVVGSEVHVYTKNIYVQNEERKTWHDIGTFHIVIGMYSAKYNTNTTVKIFNTKHQIHAFEALMQAPHVFSDGHICHGNIVSAMVDSYKRRDLFQMISIIIMFLESANLDDAAGAYIRRWPIVTEEETKAKDIVDEFADCFEEKTKQEAGFDEKLNIPIFT